MKYLLDTNICIHLLRGRMEVAEAIDKVGLSNCCISEITKAELLVGEALAIRRGIKSSRPALERFISCLDVIPISSAIESYAGEKARLISEGLQIEDFDLLTACSAVSSGAILVTENESHMRRVAGVRLENWVSR